jgi:hypothetical protein
VQGADAGVGGGCPDQRDAACYRHPSVDRKHSNDGDRKQSDVGDAAGYALFAASTSRNFVMRQQVIDPFSWGVNRKCNNPNVVRSGAQLT